MNTPRSTRVSRRRFLERSAMAAAAVAAWPAARAAAAVALPPGSNMAFGLVTYQWGKDWDLPTLLANCQKAGVMGVELRTTHKHGVEPSLTDAQREEVANRFGDSRVMLVGLGSNERFDDPDPEVVKKAIEATKAFIVLSHDIGSTGVKVKPDSFHADVPHEKTIEQIGRALNELAEFGGGYGQQIRLEVHGQCRELPTIAAILKVADNPNVVVCWNCNEADTEGQGLQYNFNLVKDRLGPTTHIHDLTKKDYPYAEFFKWMVRSDYNGWLMLEDAGRPEDPVAALKQQRELFAMMIETAQEDT